MKTFLLAVILVINQCYSLPNHLVDLTWPFENTTIYWPGEKEFQFSNIVAKKVNDEYWYAAKSFCAAEHGGTHLDAPYHFFENGWKVGDIPLEKLVVNGMLLDISKDVEKVGASRNLLESDLIEFEIHYGPIKPNTVMLIKFGWSQYYSDRKKYLGITEENKLNFPGLSRDAARWLAANKNIVGVGLDVASVDPGNSVKFEAHRFLSGSNLYNIENVKLVEDLPANNFTLLVMPMNIKEGTGAPLRLVAAY